MTIPSGIITIWSGTIADIPSGWHICDGTAGTPDLRDKFIVGAGDAYNPGDAGGSTTHIHPYSSAPHTHGFAAGFGIAAGIDYDPTLTSRVVSGTTDTGSSLPPYYALAYMMKT